MKKYNALLCVTLALALIVACFAVFASATSGSWSDYAESDNWYKNYLDAPTFEINSAERLASFARLVNEGNSFEGKVINIKSNIDLTAHYWVPIGNENCPFKGTVTGNLNTISGMHINALNGNCAGLFGYIQAPGEVSNLTIKGEIGIWSSGNIGGAVGLAASGAKITAISTNVSISVSGSAASDVGGILGKSSGADIKYCSAEGEITITDASLANVGGIVGEIAVNTEIAGNKSSQTKSKSMISVTAGTANVGGILGSIASGAELKNEVSDTDTEYVWSLGEITVNASNSANVGGFIGKLEGVANLANAKFANSITVSGEASANVGGIVGAQKGNIKSTLSNCSFATGFSVMDSNQKEILTVPEDDRKITVTASGTVHTGGIYGSAERLDVISPTVGCASETSGKNVSIKSVGTVGGIGGNSVANATVTDEVNITLLTVTGTGNNAVVGGVFGEDSATSKLSVSAKSIIINVEGASNVAGGVIGKLNSARNFDISGEIEVTGTASSANATLGGIVGGGSGTLKQTDVADEIKVNSKKSAKDVGGIVGTLSGGIDTLTVHNTVTVMCDSTAENIGGIAGVSGAVNSLTVKKAISVTADGKAGNIGGTIGSLAGSVQSVTINDALSITASEDAGSVGGVIGSANAEIDGVTAYDTVTVDANKKVTNLGGIIGNSTKSADNIVLKKAVAVTANGEAENVGGIAGNAAETISNITADDTITVETAEKTTNIGGLIGNSGGIDTLEIKDKVSVTANSEAVNVGGIAGHLCGKLDACTMVSDVEVTVQKTTAGVGGAVGSITSAGKIGSAEGKKLTFKGAVNVICLDKSVNVGGAVGNACGAVNYVYTEMPVTVAVNEESSNIGGIIGNSSADASNIIAYDLINVTADKKAANIGGVIGSIGGNADTVTLEKSVNVIAKAETETLGGIIGKAGQNVKNVTVKSDISTSAIAVSEYGGVIGFAFSGTGTVDTVDVLGNISLSADADTVDVGGVVGRTDKSFSKLNVTGNVTVLCKAESENAAGAVGKISGNLSNVTVSGIIDITCTGPASNVAGVVGMATGNITKVTVTDTEPNLLNKNNITVNCIDTSSNAAGIAANVTGNVSTVNVTGKVALICEKTVGNIGGAVGSVTGNLGAVTLNDNVSISANDKATNAGGVAGKVTSLLETVCVTGKISVTCEDNAESIGGIVGFVGDGMLDINVEGETDVTANATITNAGGIAGIIEAGGLDTVAVNGKITVKCADNAENAGGIAGNSAGTTTNIAVVGNIGVTVTGAVKNIGGFAGIGAGNLDTLSINGDINIKCENIADNIGGLLGKMTGSVGKTAVSGFSVTGDTSITLVGGKRNGTTPVNFGGMVGDIQGSIYNATVEGNITISAKDAAPVTDIGGVAGFMAGNLDKLNISGNIGVTINRTAENGGGIIGCLTGDLANVTVSGNMAVTAKDVIKNIGGLCGIQTGNLSELRYTGALTVKCNKDADYAGGLCGVYNGVMSAVHTSGSIGVRCEGDKTYAGGIAGSFEGAANGLANYQNDFNILGELSITLSGTGNDYTVGAFAGINKGILENISLGDNVSVTVNSRTATIGGFAGVNDGTVKYAYTTADIKTNLSSAATLGGLVGINKGTVAHSARDIDVSLNVTGDGILDSFVGGLIGQNSGTVEKSYTDCDVVLNGEGITGGGLVGCMNGGLVTNSYAGDKSVTGGKIVGGLIGTFGDGKTEYCYSAMKISDAEVRGGIFGEYIPNTVDEHVLLCRFLSDGINYNMLPAGKGGAGILDQDIKYIRALSGAQLQDGRAESGFFNYYDFDTSETVSWDFDNVWQFVISNGAKYIYPSLVIDADEVTLNYDIRWYTENPNADSFTLSNDGDLSGFAMILNGKFEEYQGVDFANKTVLVSRNINIQRSNWEPIENFKGIFNGQNYLINGLRVSNTVNAGLFGTILPEASIINLTIEVDKATGTATAGAVAGINNGTVANAVVTVKDRITAPDAGSVVGINNGSITGTDAYLVGTVYGSMNAGGIVGNNSADIKTAKVTVNGTVKGDTNAGGISGVSNGSISDSNVTVNGTVNGAEKAGGAIGDNSGSIEKPVSTVGSDGTVVSDLLAGGIVANNTGTILTPAVVIDGKIEAENAGGIAGASTTNLANCNISGSGAVFGTEYAGGIVSVSDNISITDSAVSGITVSGNSIVGGVSGEVNKWSIDKITIDGVIFKSEDANATLGAVAGRTTAVTAEIVLNGTVGVTFENTAKNVGGIVGAALGNITKLEFNGNIDAKLNGKAENAGGVIGYTVNDIENTVINSKTAVMSTTNEGNVGGIIGYMHGNLRKLHYSGEISVTNEHAEGYVGGLIGNYEGTMSDIHTTGRILIKNQGTTDITGGIVGCFDGTANGISGNNNDINFLGEMTIYDAGGTVGAFVGENSGTIKNISLGDNVKITVNAPAATVGGFAGKNSGTLDFVYSTADITCMADGDTVLGGLVGENSGNVKRSGRDIAVILTINGNGGKSFVGGLIGSNSGSVEKCFADCEVSCSGNNADIGGLIGSATGGSITDCYASDVGGVQAEKLIGSNSGAEVLSSYSAMEMPASFEGYDFENVWQQAFADGAKYKNPCLILNADNKDVILNYDLRWYTKNAEADEFKLEDEEDLAGFAMILNGRFEEFYGIDFAGKKVIVSSPMNLIFGNWEPIKNFKGVFDGSKNLINGLRVTESGSAAAPDNAGLFDTVLTEAQISNLNIEVCTITGNDTAGAVAGINNGKISDTNATLKDSVSAKDAGVIAGINKGSVTDPIINVVGAVHGGKNAGGISGSNSGNIDAAKTVVSGTVQGADTAGGVAGVNSGNISNPEVTVSDDGIVISDLLAGGIVANNKNNISSPVLVLNGKIEAPSAGGVVGDSTTNLTDCSISGTGTVLGTTYAGGIVSKVSGIDVSDCTAYGITVSGNAYIGGAAGEITGGIVESNEIKDVKLAADNNAVFVGGIAGRIAISDNADKFWNSRPAVYQGIYKSKITGLAVTAIGAGKIGNYNAQIGGIVGAVNGGSVYECGAEGEISVSGYKELAVGGAVGKAESAYFVGNSVSMGITVNYAQSYDVGGFVGRALNSTLRFNKVKSEKEIDISYTDANEPVKVMYLGGFAGQIDNTADWIISENTADQDVKAVSLFTSSGNVSVGGFAGQIGGTLPETKVSKCFALGNAYGDGKAYAYAGGFVGEFHSGDIELSYAEGNAVTAISPTGAYAGGFVGRLMNASNYITDCYAADGTIFARADGANAYADAFHGNKIGNLTNVYGSAKSVVQEPMGTKVVRDNEFILPEQNNPLNAGIKLEGFDFEGMTWLYVEGKNSGRPVLSVFVEDGAFMPDIEYLKNQNISSFAVSNADEFAAAAHYMNDRTIAKLFVDGRAMVGSTDITLTDDIMLTGLWIPIKELMAGEILDGGNHTVSGLKLADVYAKGYGLVGKNNGNIKNLTVAESTVIAGDDAALVAGTNEGTVENIVIAPDAAVTGNGNVGAVVGTNNGSVAGVVTSAVVKGGTVGGIAGINNGIISDTETKAKVNATEMTEQQNSGGVAGINMGTITGINSSAEVSGYYAGGIAGTNGGVEDGIIESSQSGARVNGEYAAGGIVGYNYKGTIGTGNYGNISSNAAVKSENGYAGGIAGINSGVGTITNSDMLLDSVVKGKYSAGITGSGSYNETTCRGNKCPVPNVDTTARTFIQNMTVRLTTEIDGAIIYYTLDGTTPTTESTLFNLVNPISLTATTTIKAIAVKDGMFASDVATFEFYKSTSSSGNGGGGGGGGGFIVPSITVNVDANGGDAIKNIKVNSGQKVSSIQTPTRKGYVFDGWYADKECTEAYDGDATINKDTTLYAGWKIDPARQIILTIGEKATTVWNKGIVNDVAPVIRQDRTMLPARFIAENLGADVEWDAEARKVIIRNTDVTIELYIGSDKAFVNGEIVVLDSPAFIENGRTYTPVRFIAETLGVTVDWNAETRQVIITKALEDIT